MILCSLLFIGRWHNTPIIVTIHNKQSAGAPLIFLPFHKEVSQKTRKEVVSCLKHMTSDKNHAVQKKIIKSQKVSVPKKVIAQKKESAQAVQGGKKSEVTRQTVVSSTPKPTHNKEKKSTQINKKNTALSTPHKSTQKAIVPHKKSVAQNSNSNAIRATSKKIQKVNSVGENPAIIGRYELSALKLQEYVVKKVTQAWHPPVGLPVDTQCTVSFKVTQKGAVDHILMCASSQSLIYDVSVKTALSQIIFEKQARGKDYTITFKI